MLLMRGRRAASLRVRRISDLKYEDMGEIIRIEASEDSAGDRLDSLLAAELDMARNAVQRLIEEGSVTLQGKAVKKNYRVTAGDVFEVVVPEQDEEVLVPDDIPLDIIYEDYDIIVINKPAGMVVHPAPGHSRNTLVNALLSHCGERLSTVGGKNRLGIVHRLDKDTSGVLLAAKTDSSHIILSRQFKEHSTKRIYEAVVRGNLREDRGYVEAPIGRHPTDRKRMAVTEKNARYAYTGWEVITRYPGGHGLSSHTHIRCILKTGRTHQIRVHMAHIGHPVVGDPVYGGRAGKGELGLQGQCLHAKQLEFSHPVSGERMSFKAELPESFSRVLTLLHG